MGGGIADVRQSDIEGCFRVATESPVTLTITPRDFKTLIGYLVAANKGYLLVGDAGVEEPERLEQPRSSLRHSSEVLSGTASRRHHLFNVSADCGSRSAIPARDQDSDRPCRICVPQVQFVEWWFAQEPLS